MIKFDKNLTSLIITMLFPHSLHRITGQKKAHGYARD